MGSRHQFIAPGHQDGRQIDQFPQPTRPIHSFDTDFTDHRSSRWSPEDEAGERGGKMEAFEELIANTVSELIEKIPEKLRKSTMMNDRHHGTSRGSVETDLHLMVRSRGLFEEDTSEEIRLERFKIRTVEPGEGAVDVKNVEDHNNKSGKKK